MEPQSSAPNKFSKGVIILGLALVAFFAFLMYLYRLNQPPAGFPTPYHVTIDPGQGLFSISNELATDGAIRSRRLFEFWMLLFGTDRSITEGEFYFTEPKSSLGMALRITGKQFGVDRKKVTFPEGFTGRDMALRLVATFPSFDAELFLSLAKEHEGYLFPDTYAFFPSVTPDVVITMLRKNFARRTEKFDAAVASSGRTLDQIITMASIVEREANGSEDRAMVAGILWRRFDEGKLLQVDAPFSVLLGKESSELTKKDLTLDSLFNTYTHIGLPPAPIANPGLAAIEATVHPTPSPYLFYLHDNSGAIYYARTYNEHLANINRYLKNRR